MCVCVCFFNVQKKKGSHHDRETTVNPHSDFFFNLFWVLLFFFLFVVTGGDGWPRFLCYGPFTRFWRTHCLFFFFNIGKVDAKSSVLFMWGSKFTRRSIGHVTMYPPHFHLMFFFGALLFQVGCSCFRIDVLALHFGPQFCGLNFLHRQQFRFILPEIADFSTGRVIFIFFDKKKFEFYDKNWVLQRNVLIDGWNFNLFFIFSKKHFLS